MHDQAVIFANIFQSVRIVNYIIYIYISHYVSISPLHPI